jgi:hypothetical protein
MLAVLPDAANSDGEFAIAARLWDADVVFVSGDDAVRFAVRAGRVGDVAPVAADTKAPVRIVGAPEGWEKMLMTPPPPFYQDLFAAWVHHGFRIEGTIEDVMPYYPALRRLIELLRAANGRNGG